MICCVPPHRYAHIYLLFTSVPSSIPLHLVLPRFTSFYLVLSSFSQFYLVLLGSRVLVSGIELRLEPFLVYTSRFN